MPQERFDSQELRRRELETAPPQTSDAQLVRQENARRFRAESERLQAERTEQENRQRTRQARHEALARQEDDAVRAKIFARYLQAQEQAKLSEPPPPVPLSTQRQDEQAAAEQAAGRRALAKYAQRNQDAAAARDRISAEEKVKDDLPGFKT